MMQQQAIPYGKKDLQFPISSPFPLDIVGSTAFARYAKVSSEETFNMMISDGGFVPFPGYAAVATISASGVARSIYTSQKANTMFCVVDNGFYSISQSLAVQKIESIATSNGTVYMAENLAGEIAISDGLNIYIYNYLTNAFTIPVIDFLPVYIAFQDTYFLAADGNTNQWRLSDNNNGNSWPNDASHVGELQTKPTNTMAAVPLDRQLFIFGQTCAEPWYDVNPQLFPYQRSNFYSIDYGTQSNASIASGFGKLIWIASNEKAGICIMYSEGAQPQKISTDGIDYRLGQVKNPQNCFGFLYEIDGHVFYHFTFPADNISYVYDFNTQKFFTITDTNLNYHIAKRITYFNGSYYFVSFIDGNLYQMGSQFTSYDGKEIPRIRICKHIRLPSSDPFVINNIPLTMEQGLSNPLQRIDLSVSKDGGVTYGNVVSKILNPASKKQNICQWWNFGYGNDFVLQWRFWGLDRFVAVSGEVRFYQ